MNKLSTYPTLGPIHEMTLDALSPKCTLEEPVNGVVLTPPESQIGNAVILLLLLKNLEIHDAIAAITGMTPDVVHAQLACLTPHREELLTSAIYDKLSFTGQQLELQHGHLDGNPNIEEQLREIQSFPAIIEVLNTKKQGD